MNKQELIDELTKYEKRYENVMDEYSQGRYGAYKVSLKLAKRLNEQNITDKQAWNKVAEAYPESAQSLRNTLDNAVFGKVDEPQKPVVPQFVAEWFEDNKDDLEFAIWKLTIDSNSDYTKNKNEMRHWIQYAPNKPYKTLIGMLNGYEVEKEPLYIMPVPHVSFPVHYCVEDNHISFRQGNAQKFTQIELDKYFPDIKQFAQSVEEVAEG